MSVGGIKGSPDYVSLDGRKDDLVKESILAGARQVLEHAAPVLGIQVLQGLVEQQEAAAAEPVSQVRV